MRLRVVTGGLTGDWVLFIRLGLYAQLFEAGWEIIVAEAGPFRQSATVAAGSELDHLRNHAIF